MVVLGSLALPAGALAEPKKSTAVHASPPARGRTPAAPRATGSAHLLGTAFRTKGGGGEVVLQTSTEVELEPRAGVGVGTSGATYLLKRCRILRNNDRRPLDTRFFDSPVTGVTLRERGPDVEIAVSLRNATAAQPRKEHGPGSSWYWVLSFPRAASAHGTPSATGGATAAANP
ncbi:MAG TPA: hypothetical protein VGP07_09680 [Polyangia bacterium]|jgi:hypothetical protein